MMRIINVYQWVVCWTLLQLIYHRTDGTLEVRMNQLEEKFEGLSRTVSSLENKYVILIEKNEQLENSSSFVKEEIARVKQNCCVPSNKGKEQVNGQCQIELLSHGYEDPGFVSGGSNVSFIKLNGQAINLNTITWFPQSGLIRGMIMVSLDKQRCTIIRAGGYDTFVSKEAAEKLFQDLRAIYPGEMVAGICYDECQTNLDPALDELYNLGVYLHVNQTRSINWFRSSFAFVATKGDVTKTQYKQLPATKGPTELKYNKDSCM